MLFLTVINVKAKDIGPGHIQVFWISSIIMIIGFLIISNLIGEFTNIINEFYESDTNNEIEENRLYTEDMLY